MKYQRLNVEIKKYQLRKTGDMLREGEEEEEKETTKEYNTKQ